MAVSKEDVQAFLKELSKLSRKQKLTLKDFDKRIGTLYDHKKAMQRLVSLFGLLKEKDTKFVRNQILGEIRFIKHEIIAEFASVIEGNIRDRDLEISLIKKQQQKYREVASIVFHDFETISTKISKGGPAKQKALEKAAEILDEAKELLKKEKKNVSLTKEIRGITKSMNKIMKSQSKILLNELNVLASIEQMVKQSKLMTLKSIQNASKKLQAVIAKVMHILHTEKEKVIDPFNKFLKEKRSVLKLVKKRGQQKKITLADIGRDIETLTESFELHLYVSSLEKYKKKIAANAKDITPLASHIETILHRHKKNRKKFQRQEKL